jgi:hypothetical protein
MPTKPLERLMFVQGDLCFFCRQPLPQAEASVEHLLASANGGTNNDENCVACCKSVNALLGSMALKEKFQVVLNQKGQFKCPNRVNSTKTAVQSKTIPKPSAAVKPKTSKLALVVADLEKRGNSKPRTLKRLMSTVASTLPKDLSEDETTALIEQLKSTGKITVSSDNKVTYAL